MIVIVISMRMRMRASVTMTLAVGMPVIMAITQQPGRSQVDQQANDGDPQRHLEGNHLGLQQTPEGFERQHRHHHQ